MQWFHNRSVRHSQVQPLARLDERTPPSTMPFPRWIKHVVYSICFSFNAQRSVPVSSVRELFIFSLGNVLFLVTVSRRLE